MEEHLQKGHDYIHIHLATIYNKSLNFLPPWSKTDKLQSYEVVIGVIGYKAATLSVQQFQNYLSSIAVVCLRWNWFFFRSIIITLTYHYFK